MNKIAYILTLTAGTAFAVAASSEEASENASVWSTFKSNTKENAGNLWEATKERSGTVWEATKAGTVTAFDATKEGAAAAASYVGDRLLSERMSLLIGPMSSSRSLAPIIRKLLQT